MRAMKSTSLTFGLVNVPVKMYKATESHDTSFSQFHGKDDCMGAIGYTKTCKCCGEVVEAGDIIRGAKQADGGVVIVTDEDLESLAVQAGPEIGIVQFVGADEIDPIAFEGHYYVAPEKTAVEGFALLRHVMVETGRVAVVRFFMRRTGSAGKAQLGLLRPYGEKAMLIDTISYPDEIRQPAFPVLDTKVALNPKLVDMARDLVESMSGAFDPSEYVDTYAVQLDALVEAKAAGQAPAVAVAEEAAATDVSDLLAKLEASVAAKPAKKAAAKAPAKKAAAKAPAKKAPAKRATKKAVA